MAIQTMLNKIEREQTFNDYVNIIAKRIFDPEGLPTSRFTIHVQRPSTVEGAPKVWDTYNVSSTFSLLNTKEYCEHIRLTLDKWHYKNGNILVSFNEPEVSINEDIKTETKNALSVLNALADTNDRISDVELSASFQIINCYNGIQKFSQNYALNVSLKPTTGQSRSIYIRPLYGQNINATHVYEMRSLDAAINNSIVDTSHRIFEFLKTSTASELIKAIEEHLPKKWVSKATAFLGTNNSAYWLVILLYMTSPGLDKDIILDKQLKNYIGHKLVGIYD